MVNGSDPGSVGRRAFLRRAGLTAGAVAVLPMLGGWDGASAAPASTPPSSGGDPDELFRAGLFVEADRGYARLLREDSGNAHALAQRGYIALLSNRFADAETYLSKAVSSAPDDIAARQRLAECFVRQDQHARAIPLLRSTGRPRDEAFAELYAHLPDAPWQVHGAQRTRVPFLGVDPLPHVQASVNGGNPKRFYLDTYATLDLSQDVAEEAGLRAVATTSGVASNGPVTIYLGVMDSFRLGDIEFRNIPVQWIDAQRPPLPDGSQAAGVIGTTLLYHALSTMDYANRALVLRRKTATQLRDFRAQVGHPGLDRLPLWLAGDHYPCTLGSLGDYGPRIVTLDTGGTLYGVDTTVEIAERAGIEVDYAHPQEFNGSTIYPITPDRISLGKAVGHEVSGMAVTTTWPGFPGPGQSALFGFDIIANFTHKFLKPFAITFDYTHRHFYITRR
ncbi:aspartyl protease family protein [Micromonospora sp. NPDC047740]|uniref:aspartyl protease family protein n=1 Tax=Micromonospora sp. NPDC047740 TaxID=3364254 RepID=UPI0037232918